MFGPTSRFLNGTHEFSELVRARMVQLMGQSRSVPPLRSAKVWGFRELRREKCTRVGVPWTFPFKLTRTSSFRREERTNGKVAKDQRDHVRYHDNSRTTRPPNMTEIRHKARNFGYHNGNRCSMLERRSVIMIIKVCLKRYLI